MSLITSLWESLFPKSEFRILIIGLDASGKTSILYRMKMNEVVTTIPTIGFNVETFTYDGLGFTAWDVGGCDKIRPLWRHYFSGTDIVLFVVDAKDRERMATEKMNVDNTTESYNIARWSLYLLIEEMKTINPTIVYLILLNKCDTVGAVSIEEATHLLDLHQYDLKVHWDIMTCSVNNDSCNNILPWCANMMKKIRNVCMFCKF